MAATLLAAPAAAPAQRELDDQAVREDTAALPERLWQPGPEPVSPGGPGLPEEDGGVMPLLAVLLVLGAVGAGFATSLLRPSPALQTEDPEPAPQADPPPAVSAPQVDPPPAVPAPLPIVHEPAVGTEVCVIGLSHAWGRGQFAVRIKDKGGAPRVVARSLSFPVPAGMVISEDGAAGRAHRRLLIHLIAAGWQIEPPGSGPWYERRLSRPLRSDGEVDRALVTPHAEGSDTEFVALALDEYGNARVLARSPRFGRRRGAPVEETEPAVAAHEILLEDLAERGWRVSGRLDGWYGATLARRRR